MAHKTCKCGYCMSDVDGSISYDVYFRSDIDAFLSEYPEKGNGSIGDIWCENADLLPYRCCFWLCDECGRAHVWIDSESRNLFRVYKVSDKKCGTSAKEYMESGKQIFPCNIQKCEDTSLYDLINTDAVFDCRYYLSSDELTVCVFDKVNNVKELYELEYESDVKTDFKIDSFDDLIVYTTTKTNDGHEYKFVDGEKQDITDTKYPYKEVHFMVREHKQSGGSLSVHDESKSPEIYNKDNMNEFFRKYGRYYENRTIIDSSGDGWASMHKAISVDETVVALLAFLLACIYRISDNIIPAGVVLLVMMIAVAYLCFNRVIKMIINRLMNKNGFYHAIGTIKAIRYQESGRGRYKIHVVQYADSENNIHIKEIHSAFSIKKWCVGDKINIKVNSDNHNEIIIPASDMALAIIMSVMGVTVETILLLIYVNFN